MVTRQRDGYRFRLRSSSYGGQVAPPILRAIMKLSEVYDDFEVKLDRIHPLPLFDKDGDPVWMKEAAN
jgi:hypothetical protein